MSLPLFRNEQDVYPERPVLLLYVKATGELGSVGVSGELMHKCVQWGLGEYVAMEGCFYPSLTSFVTLCTGGSRLAANSVVVKARQWSMSGYDKKVIICGEFSRNCLVQETVLTCGRL